MDVLYTIPFTALLPLMSSSPIVVKRLDRVFDKDTRIWTYRETKGEPVPLVLPGGKNPDGTDVWKECCFVVVREMPADPDSTDEPDVAVTIKSPHLRAVCKRVIGDVAKMGSWSIEPLEVTPAFYCICYSITYADCSIYFYSFLSTPYFGLCLA